jgi:hypothetical protein
MREEELLQLVELLATYCTTSMPGKGHDEAAALLETLYLGLTREQKAKLL